MLVPRFGIPFRIVGVTRVIRCGLPARASVRLSFAISIGYGIDAGDGSTGPDSLSRWS
jgi:hypothetical protein